jgi:hypothetical protein
MAVRGCPSPVAGRSLRPSGLTRIIPSLTLRAGMRSECIREGLLMPLTDAFTDTRLCPLPVQSLAFRAGRFFGQRARRMRARSLAGRRRGRSPRTDAGRLETEVACGPSGVDGGARGAGWRRRADRSVARTPRLGSRLGTPARAGRLDRHGDAQRHAAEVP